VVAVDVGGTSIKGAVVDAGGTILWARSWPTPAAAGPDRVIDAIREAVRDLAGACDAVAAVGVVVPGAVDSDAGVASYSANLGWRDVPLRDVLAEDTGVPCVLDHDIRAGGVAEHTIGKTAGVDDSLTLIIGTGIAGLITSNGRFVRGAGSIAGEAGHLPVWPDGEPCPCGQRGCLERYASAAAISRRYAARTGTVATSADVVGRLDSDPAAAQVWQEAVSALGIALASCTMLLDPGVIVLSGGLSAAGAALLDPVRAELAARVVWRPTPTVELSDLGARAGLLGAAILAWQRAGATDFRSWVPEATA